MKRWLENWKRTGPLLEQDRWDRLAALTDEEAQQASLDLLDLWQPDWRATMARNFSCTSASSPERAGVLG